MDLRFKPIVKLTEYKLPFELTQPGLASWLETLPAAGSYTSCYEILCVLQNFYTINLTAKLKLSLLHKISACLSIHAETLESTYLDSGYPLRSVEQGNVEIIAWCYGELANNFLHIFNSHRDSERISKKKLMAKMLYQFVQHMGQAYLYMSEVYTQPYDGFWTLFYQALEVAEQANLLDVNVSEGRLEQNTINNVCKKILVFELCDSNQFRPREMKKIYQILEKIVAGADLFVKNQKQNKKGLCVFNLREDMPPENLLEITEKQGNFIRYIDTVIVAKNIYQYFQRGLSEHGALRAINEALFYRLIRTLGVAHKRKYTRIRDDRKCSGIVGINNVINLLGKSQLLEIEALEENAPDLNAIASFDPRTSSKWGELDVDLVPHEDVVLHQMHETNKIQLCGNEQVKKFFAVAPLQTFDADDGIWSKSRGNMNCSFNPVSCENFEIRDSSVKGYSMIWNAQKINAKIGDILGIVTDFGSRVEIGLIRRIKPFSEETIQLGVELIGMKSELVYICRPSQKNAGTWGLLLPREETLKIAESVVFDSSDYLPGEFVCLQQGAKEVRCRLQKLLHSTSAISHIELYYPKKDE